MELKADLLKSVKGYFALLENEIDIILHEGDHPKREDLKSFLKKIVSLSDIKPYNPPAHFDMVALKIQGEEETGLTKFWQGLIY